LALQIAKARGAHVITTASASKRELVLELGADQVIDYKTTDFTSVVRDVDVVLDTVGGDYGTRSIDVLRPGGSLVTIVERTNVKLAELTEQKGRKFLGIAVEPDRVGLEQLARLVDEGKLRVHVSHTIPFEQAARAHQLLDAHGVSGKIVLVV
jgi:NADPH:quinone reductase-like Zn-dependent oxidoreductase